MIQRQPVARRVVHEVGAAIAAAVAPTPADAAAARRIKGRQPTGRIWQHGWSLWCEPQFRCHELDVPDQPARLAPELAGEQQRVEGARDRHRPGHLVIGNRPDVLGFCQHVRKMELNRTASRIPITRSGRQYGF